MAAASGIQPSQETLNTIEELRKNQSRFLYALFKIEGDRVVPDKSYPSSLEEAKAIRQDDATYAKNFDKTVWPLFVKDLEGSDGPRFAVIDFAFTHPDGRAVRTLTSISYCPDKGVPLKLKMMFASTKGSFEAKINIGKKYQANDASALEYETVLEVLRANK